MRFKSPDSKKAGQTQVFAAKFYPVHSAASCVLKKFMPFTALVADSE